MEIYLAIVLLVIVWFTLMDKIGAVSKKLDAVKKNLDALLEKPTLVTKEVPSEQEVSVPVVEEPYQPAYFLGSEIRPAEILEDEEPLVEESAAMEESIQEMPAELEPEPDFEPEPLAEPLVVPEKTKINYEKYIGENLFGKIGILVLVVGIGLFVKYAIDNEWINETLRTVLGFAVGFGLLVVAERLREKYRTFSSLLAGGGFAIFYITVAIAYHYYQLFSQPVAFIILVVLTVLMSALAILYDRRELAVISLVGGFIAPFLVSSGEGSYMVLFSYITLLNLGMFGLSLYKKWAELPVISFAFSWLILLIYTFNQAFTEQDLVLMNTRLLGFATLFFLIFLLPVLSILKNESLRINRILLSVIVANNFIYLGFGLSYLSNIPLPFSAEGLLTLFVAVINLALILWLRRGGEERKFLVYTMLGLVLTFVSITVPLQLQGNYITLFWASEMVLFAWLYIRSRIRLYELASLILALLTLVSFLMDIVIQAQSSVSGTMLLNSMFATNLFTGLAFMAYAYLLSRYRSFFDTARILTYYPWNVVFLITSIAVLYYSCMNELYQYMGDLSLSSMFLFTISCILVVTVALKNRFPFHLYANLYTCGMTLSAILYLLDAWLLMFNPFEFASSSLVWASAGVVIATLVYVAKQHYAFVRYKLPESQRFTILLNVLASFLLVNMVSVLLWQGDLQDEQNAGLSVILTVIGLVQMSLGMRLHFRLMRIISLVTFGLVLFKLVAIDLWSMPTVGKIIVFIILGVILLVLSFLYQKLKDVLFSDEPNEN